MAGEYTISYSNPSKGSFILGPNTVDGPGYTNQTTPLLLPGRYVPNYGVVIAKSLVYLLENFANVVPPSNPTIGMIWFKMFASVDPEHGNGILHVYNPDHPDAGTTGSVGWLAVGSGIGGSGGASGGAGGRYEPALSAGNFTAVSGGNYFINTTTTAITVTLPLDPEIGDVVGFIDMAGTFNVNHFTVSGNGKLIMGDPSNMENDVRYSYFRLCFSGDTHGWRLSA